MKFTPKQEALMRSMCMERKSNQEIADAVGVQVTKVHAWRSRNNLTRKKVEKLLSGQPEENEAKKKHTVDPALLLVLDTCEWQLDKVVSFIVDVLDSDHLCRHCSSYNDPNSADCNLSVCGIAAAKCIREKMEKKL